MDCVYEGRETGVYLLGFRIVGRSCLQLVVEVAQAVHLAAVLNVGVPLLAVLVPADALELGRLGGGRQQPLDVLHRQAALWCRGLCPSAPLGTGGHGCV